MHIKSFGPLTLAGIALAILGAFIALSLAPAPSAEAQTSKSVRNLTLTESSPTEIEVTWDAASGTVWYYRVEWSGPTSGNRRYGPDTQRDTIFALSPGTYTVKVGVWRLGDSGFGNYASATITLGDSGDTPGDSGDTPQLLVENPRLTQTGLRRMAVEWNAASGNVFNYEVRWTGPTSGSYALGNTASSHSITGLSHGTYTVKVRVSRQGSGGFVDYVSGTIAVSDGRPENLTLTRLSDEAMSFAWEPPTYPSALIASYEVFVTMDAPPYTAYRAELQADQREYRLTGLEAEMDYEVSVRAITRPPYPLNYSVMEVTTLAPPGAVADLSAEAIVNGLDVSWTERPDSESIFVYELQYTTDGSDYSRPYQVFEGSQTINSLTAGQEYTVRVRSCGYSQIAGDGPFCSAWSETTGTPDAASTALLDAPSPPQNLQLSIVDGNRLRVNWDEPAGGWEPAEMLAADSDYGFKYVVTLQNEEDAKTVWKRPGYKKPWAVFRNLEEGATYKASVQAIIRDAQRVKNDREDHNSHWVKSEWVSATVTVPEEGEGGETPGGGIGTEPYRLVWVQLAAGEPTPPNAVGEPTRHVRAVPGTADYERFDPVAECIAADGGGAVSFQQSAVDTVEEIYNKWQDLADANPGVQYFADEAAKRKADLDAAKAKLDEVKAKLASDCEAKFPPENLTQDDVRWVQVPAPLEKVDDED